MTQGGPGDNGVVPVIPSDTTAWCRVSVDTLHSAGTCDNEAESAHITAAGVPYPGPSDVTVWTD